jgi:hypothetical protein
MGAAHQFSQHHCGTADSGAQRDHNDILHTVDYPRVLFAKQGHPSIILYPNTKAELLKCPLIEIQMNRIFKLLQRGENAAVPHIHYPGEPDCNAVTLLRSCTTLPQESPKRFRDAGQKRFERFR